MFKKSDEYLEIYDELNKNLILNKYACFDSYSEKVFIYIGVFDYVKYTFEITSDDDFLDRMSLIDLLDCRNIKRFELSISIRESNLYKKISSKVYSEIENANLN